MRDIDLAEMAAALLDDMLEDSRPLHGGDLSRVVRLRMLSGREAVVKNGPAPMVEAGMLRAIRAVGVAAPEVLACSPEVLVLELLPEYGALDGQGWADLGSALRQLHSAEGPYFGWVEDYAFGQLAIPNARLPDWPAFWAERRLSPALPELPPGLAVRLKNLMRDLPNRLPARPPASLLHGDLWTGNLLADRGRLSGLIDPACYYGHGEVDLAMLNLFGSTGAGFIEAYGNLEPGWEERRAIYQLWPALVHFRLFGSGYRSMVSGLLDRLGV